MTWGPDYWYEIGRNIHLEPGQGISITASLFGESNQENLAATHAHISLIGELFFVGDTPEPDLNRGQQYYRYILEIGDAWGVELATYLKCRDDFQKGGWYNIVSCLLDVGENDQMLEKIRTGLSTIGITVGKESLKVIYKGLNKAKDIIVNIGKATKHGEQEICHW